MILRRAAAAYSFGLLFAGCQDNPYTIGHFRDDLCATREQDLVCSGFEQPDLSDWGEQVLVNAGSLAQTEQVSRRGRGALLAGSTDRDSAAAVAKEFSSVTSGSAFLRVFMLIPSGVETKTTNVLFLGDQPAPDPFKGIDFNFESDAPEIFVPENDPVRFTSTSLVVPRDRWFCFEADVLVSEAAGAVQIRIDGAVALDQTGLDTLPPQGVHLIRAGVDWSSKQTTPFAIYMDDLVLSAAPVGCGD
ncbi:MAG TPA: hypothetical protein VFQ61_11690 [Polyangiaceae bacterium]|nr:hypothetical protein [Polyangiaceae bacterium]